MHDAVIGRRMRAPSLLMYWQRIHVGAQCNSTLAAATAQRSDDAGSCETPVDWDAELCELRSDEVGGAVLLESHFRMGVNVVPPRCHGGMELGDAIKDGHESLRKQLRPLY
jgi:hypothetical protein